MRNGNPEMKVKLSDIFDAIEFTNQDSECFLDKKTGEIVTVSDMMTSEEKEAACDALDEHSFYRLPTQFELLDHDAMESSEDVNRKH